MPVVHAHWRNVIPRHARSTSTAKPTHCRRESSVAIAKESSGPVSACCRVLNGGFKGQLEARDDATSWIRIEDQASRVAVERCESGMRVGQTDTSSETLVKTHSVIDNGNAKSVAKTLPTYENGPALR